MKRIREKLDNSYLIDGAPEEVRAVHAERFQQSLRDAAMRLLSFRSLSDDEVRGAFRELFEAEEQGDIDPRFACGLILGGIAEGRRDLPPEYMEAIEADPKMEGRLKALLDLAAKDAEEVRRQQARETTERLDEEMVHRLAVARDEDLLSAAIDREVSDRVQRSRFIAELVRHRTPREAEAIATAIESISDSLLRHAWRLQADGQRPPYGLIGLIQRELQERLNIAVSVQRQERVSAYFPLVLAIVGGSATLVYLQAVDAKLGDAFFSASAQVLPVLLLALAVETRFVAPIGLERLLTLSTVALISVGLIAASFALLVACYSAVLAALVAGPILGGLGGLIVGAALNVPGGRAS